MTKCAGPESPSRRVWLGRWVCLPFLSLGLPGMAPATPRAGLKRWGSGAYRYFGFHLYDATLWAGDDPEKPPLALALTYQRKISGQQIVDVSLKEMRRLGSSEADLQRWAPRLLALIPDVSPGDRLTGEHTANGASFQFNGLPRGEIAEEAFARQFFAIWLDPRTRAPELRAALLRISEG